MTLSSSCAACSTSTTLDSRLSLASFFARLFYLWVQIFDEIQNKRRFLGVPYFEADFCARLLGEKIFFTEFMAFQSLATAKEYREMGREKCDCDGNQKWLSELSETIMTYALCGFANIPVTCLFYKIINIQRGKQTMGIMLGTMAGLAPKRKKVFSKILAKTCVAGTICCLIRGCIACIFVRIASLRL